MTPPDDQQRGSITTPGTIVDLVADAAAAGHQTTARLVRDWTQAGLLDYPQRRPAGKGHGFRAALYPANQRMLFLILLHHRPANRISSLARIPVGLWMYCGEQYVPIRQAHRAMKTWIWDPRASKEHARDAAREVLRQLDHPEATHAARRELVESIAKIAYTVPVVDYADLERRVRDVFEPAGGRLRRAIGHPAAPLTADSILVLVKARLAAVRLLAERRVDDDAVNAARQAHLIAYAEYAAQQSTFATAAPVSNPTMYEQVST